MKSTKVEPLNPEPSKSQIFITNLLENKKRLVFVLLSFFLLGLISGLSYYTWNKTKTKTYRKTETASQLIQESQTKGHLKKFYKIASRYPSLQSQLDTTLAQEYLNQHNSKVAHELYNRIVKRQKGRLHLVDQFNRITFLIEEKEYEKALYESYQLKKELQKNSSLKTLYSQHLVRLVALEEKLGHAPEKKQLLGELIQLEDQAEEATKESLYLGHLNLVTYLNN